MSLHITIEGTGGADKHITLHANPDGTYTCHDNHVKQAVEGLRRDAGEPARARTSARPAAAKPPATKPEAKPVEAKPTAAKPPAAKPAAAKPAAAKRDKRKSLEWKPTIDKGNSGFVARTDGGQYKILKSRSRQWAVFLERPDTRPTPLGCLPDTDRGLSEAKARAQRDHDTRPRSGSIIEATADDACPVDPGSAPPPAPEPTPATPGTPAGGDEAELMGSLVGAIKQGVADDDDDDE